MQQLLQLVEQHKAGMPVGIFSVCSAHPRVLKAALRQAKARGTPVLVEATSNQSISSAAIPAKRRPSSAMRCGAADEVGRHAIACGWAAIIWGPTHGKIARLRRRWRWRKP